MSDYLRNLTVILAIGAVFGYIFAPQIDQMKTAWLARRKKRADEQRRRRPRG